MTDRTEMLEAVMNCLPEGVLVFGSEDEVTYCNQAAADMMGYEGSELVGRGLPGLLRSLQPNGTLHLVPPAGHRTLVHLLHKLGHEVPAITRTTVLRNRFGEPIGKASFFHPFESPNVKINAKILDAWSHGETAAPPETAEVFPDLEDRLQLAFDEFQRGGLAFGALLIGTDQLAELHRTHGVAACQAMLEKVHLALARGLLPGEELGRWGEEEFLILAHEHTPEMLAAHARTLAGLAGSADFRWWGDRIPITVSIGAAQAQREPNETLAQLLDRARAAREVSIAEGGNRISSAPTPLEEDCATTASFAATASLFNRRQSDRKTSGGNSCLPS